LVVAASFFNQHLARALRWCAADLKWPPDPKRGGHMHQPRIIADHYAAMAAKWLANDVLPATQPSLKKSIGR
jgi:hypothetical protein